MTEFPQCRLPHPEKVLGHHFKAQAPPHTLRSWLRPHTSFCSWSCRLLHSAGRCLGKCFPSTGFHSKCSNKLTRMLGTLPKIAGTQLGFCPLSPCLSYHHPHAHPQPPGTQVGLLASAHLTISPGKTPPSWPAFVCILEFQESNIFFTSFQVY